MKLKNGQLKIEFLLEYWGLVSRFRAGKLALPPNVTLFSNPKLENIVIIIWQVYKDVPKVIQKALAVHYILDTDTYISDFDLKRAKSVVEISLTAMGVM